MSAIAEEKATADRASAPPSAPPFFCTQRLWDLESGASRVLTGHMGGVTALAILPDGRALSGSHDWSVIVWNVARAVRIAAFVGDAAMTCVAVTSTHLLAGSANSAVHLLRLRQ